MCSAGKAGSPGISLNDAPWASLKSSKNENGRFYSTRQSANPDYSGISLERRMALCTWLRQFFLLQFRLILLGYYLPVTTNLGHLRGYRYAFDKPDRV